MLDELALEVREGAWAFVLQLHPRRPIGIARSELFHVLFQQEGHRAGDLRAEILPLGRICPIAAAGDRQRAGARRMPEAEMQRCEPAHGKADDMGAPQLQMIQHGGDVVGRAVLRILPHILRHIRRRIAAGVVRDCAVALAEMAQLRLPAPEVAGEFVHEDDRRPGACILVIELHPVIGSGVRHASPQTLPHTSSTISTRRASLIHWSASERSLPCAVEEKPHWWLSAHWSSGTYLVASTMRRLTSSFGSAAARFELMRPSTIVALFGAKRSGAKSPERSSSYSRKKPSIFISLSKISATGS